MKKIIDITGRKFGRLTVIKLDHLKEMYNRKGVKNGHKTYWLCKCDCGNNIVVRKDLLLNGSSKSCGCLKKEQDRKNLNTTTHGLSYTRLNSIWRGIKKRCLNNNCKAFPKYGGRGIKIYSCWINDFKSFYDWSIANGYKDDLTIDRINSDGNYEPSNCRWVDMKTQQRNRTNNKLIAYKGETHTLPEWCEILHLSYGKVRQRIRKGVPFDKAIKY